MLIIDGTIINADQTVNADILISNGKIQQIGKVAKVHYSNEELINARDLLIFPGGIDPHVHMQLPTLAGTSSDSFYSGSIAALHGGTTTIIDFVTPQKDEFLPDAFNKRAKEAAQSLVDFSFHVSPITYRETMENEITQMIKKGVTSFKVYMAYQKTIGLNDVDLLKIMELVANQGALLTLHCELGNEIEKLQDEFIKKGKISPKFHPLSRPDYMEAHAVKKVIDFARKTDCPLYIVHVSTKKAINFIREAQKQGQIVYAETCPHYLIYDDSVYQNEFVKSAPFVMSPPLRKKEDIESLWGAIENGTIHTIGTDHCPFNNKQKELGNTDFRKIPNGIGGIEHRIELLYTYGVLQKEISVNRMIELVATNPAKIFGLYPRKGEISVGADADLVLWNPNYKHKISVNNHHMNCDLNIYEGIMVQGRAEEVIVSGEIIIKNGLLIKKRKGNFLKRNLGTVNK